MTIEGAVLDELSEKIFDLGEAELDIAQYAQPESTERFMLEVEL
jgi:hypothetical protein